MNDVDKINVEQAAKMYGKDPSWVRAGIIEGWLPIGHATRKGVLVTSVNDINSKKGRINYYVSLSKVKEDIGL